MLTSLMQKGKNGLNVNYSSQTYQWANKIICPDGSGARNCVTFARNQMADNSNQSVEFRIFQDTMEIAHRQCRFYE